MNKVLILGGSGNTGRRIAELLLEFTDFYLILASRNIEIKEYSRVRQVSVDTLDRQNLFEVFKEIDLVISAATPSSDQQIYNIIDAAIQNRCHYIDITTSYNSKLDYLNKIKSKINDKLFITDAGAWPGLPLAMIRHANRLAGNLTEAYVAGIFHKPGWEDEVSKETLYEHELMRNELDHHIKDSTPRVFDFPKGRFECYPTYLKEIELVSKVVPTIINSGLFSCSSLSYNLESIMSFKMFGKGNRNIELTLSHKDGWVTTAASVAILAIQIFIDKRTGLYLSSEFINTDDLFSKLHNMGVDVAINISDIQE